MDDRYAGIRTPPRGFSLSAPLLSGRAFPAFLARLGIRRALSKSAPLKLGGIVLAVRSLAARIVERWRADGDIYGLCLDALRRWPHNPILIRKAAADTVRGGVPIKAGERVIAWTQAAMQDPGAFPDPERALPDRPMPSYLHLGAGLHPCAGRAINAIQIPILIGLLLDAGGKRCGKMGWSGPFPDSLPVKTGTGRDRGGA